MNSELNQYITFLNEALGVQTILLAPAENTSTIKKQTIKYFIYVENLNNYTAEESALLEKMIGALKLDLTTFGVFDLNENLTKHNSESGLKVILKDQPKENGEIYSPRILLAQPELKRTAWDDLKLTFKIK